MMHARPFMLAVAAAAAACMPATRAGGPSRSGVVTILHTNDIHGTLAPIMVDTGDATAQTGDPGRSYQEYPRKGTIGGFARVGAAVEAIRARRGAANVLLVDAGDTFGDGLLENITRGAGTLRMMDALGYDFMALGNHDYEYTAARTRALQDSVRFPMRAANAIERSTGRPFLGDPTLVREVGGIRVGLLALTYHNTSETGRKEDTRELQFISGIEAARRWVPELRRRSDIVVVVSHQGTVVDSLLASQVPGVDIIVGGHSHDRIQPPRRIGSTWVVQALSDATALGELTVNVRDGRVAGVEGRVIELYADRHPEDPRLARMLDSMRAPHRDTLGGVIAVALDRIGRQYKSESPVDRLAGDLLREHTGADVAFLPGLGFGVTIQPGPITREMLIQLFPHPTTVVREVLTGEQVVAVLEQSATNLRPGNDMDRVGGLIQTSGVRYVLDLRRPTGSRVSQVMIGGAPIVARQRYRVVTNGGLLQGTHRQLVFGQGEDVRRDGTPFSVVLEELLRARGTVKSPRLGDVRMVK